MYPKPFLQLIFMQFILNWRASASPLNDLALRVIGGEPDLKRFFPFQVALRLQSKENTSRSMHLCSGSILSRRWVLTAAHCAEVVASQYNLFVDVEDGPDSEQQEVLVESVFMHPKYDSEAAIYDIALLYLEEDIEYSDHVQSIELPRTYSEPNGSVIASGWGLTEDGKLSSVLLFSDKLQILSNERCNKEGAWGKILDNQICVVPSVPGAKIDVCKGDSGGPLIEKTDEGTVLIGIVSFGSSCQYEPAENPGVYTKVSHFIPWILKTTLQHEQQQVN